MATKASPALHSRCKIEHTQSSDLLWAYSETRKCRHQNEVLVCNAISWNLGVFPGVFPSTNMTSVDHLHLDNLLSPFPSMSRLSRHTFFAILDFKSNCGSLQFHPFHEQREDSKGTYGITVTRRTGILVSQDGVHLTSSSRRTGFAHGCQWMVSPHGLA